MNDLDSGPHAVRWARRELKHLFDMDWTQWHWTEDASFTLCGVAIPIALPGGSFCPDTDDEESRVTCRRCLRRLAPSVP